MSDGTTGIRYVGRPTTTESGRDVLAFHLHRFLTGWLSSQRLQKVWVTIGFEESAAEPATFTVTPHRFEDAEVSWTFDDLCKTYRHGDGCLRIEQRGSNDELVLEAIPILDRPEDEAHSVLLGFIVIDESAELGPNADAELQRHAVEAVRTARRNGVRLFFDEHAREDVKPALYHLLEHVPEWTACDGSAMVILSNSLETLTLEAGGDEFYVMADRLFRPAEERSERLVGMRLSADSATVLGDAITRQQRDPGALIHLYVKEDGGWHHSVDGDRALTPLHDVERGAESMLLLVPLLSRQGSDDELLGFLSLVYREERKIGEGTTEAVSSLADRLAGLLRTSPLYTLSARKLWLLRQIRGACESEVARPGVTAARVERLIGTVTELVAEHTGVPSFSAAYIKHEETDDETVGQRVLRYVHPFGWTHFEQLNLPIDVSSDGRTDSGVTALSVRLNRPLVLAGGRVEGDSLEFKNFLHVDETSGLLVDARAPGATELMEEGDWVRLGAYYKPARESAYATVAHPISFDGEPLGVLAVEVDKDTSWYWWTGYGGQLLWELIASELAFAFYAIGLRHVD